MLKYCTIPLNSVQESIIANNAVIFCNLNRIVVVQCINDVMKQFSTIMQYLVRIVQYSESLRQKHYCITQHHKHGLQTWR